jgi:Tetratricopeptide repeat
MSMAAGKRLPLLGIASIGLILIIAAITLIFCFRDETEIQIDLAKNAFSKGNCEECRHHLQETSKKISPDRAKLYRAYLARAEGDLELSSSLLESALEMAYSDETSETPLEILLNLALNSYLQEDGSSLQAWSQEAEMMEPNQPATRLITAMTAYSLEEYKRAADLLEELSPDQIQLGWLSSALANHWTKRWHRFCQAHCAAECDDLVRARELLNEEPREALTTEEMQWQTFLMGLTYARQAELKSLDGSVPYFRLAQSYFDQLPEIPPRFLQVQHRLERQWAVAAHRFLSAGKIGESTHLCRLLERWHSSDQIAELAVRMSEQLIVSAVVHENRSEVAGYLDLLLCDGELREGIAQRLSQELARAILEEETRLLPIFWEMAITMTKEPKLLSAQIAALLTAQIPLELVTDDLQLSRTRALLDLWKRTASDQVLSLARVLVAQTPHLSVHPNQIDKARQVIEIAANLPQNQEEAEIIRHEISECLVLLRAEAQAANDAASMLAWEQLGDQLGLVITDGSDVGDIANLLADADYLYRAGRYSEALERAILVRRAEPASLEANRLVGLSCYQLGRYSEAIKLLSNPQQEGQATREALAISLIECERPGEGIELLEALSMKSPLSDRGYLALAAARTAEGRTQEALHWLNSIHEPSEESALLRLYAEGIEGRWPEAWKAHRSLSLESQAIPEVNALLALGYIDQERVGLARKAVAAALKEQPATKPLVTLLQTNPFWAAAQLAYLVDKDRQEALDYIEKIDCPTAESLLFEGKIRLEIGDFEGAERALLLAQTSGQLPDVSHLLCTAWQEMGFVEDAALATPGEAPFMEIDSPRYIAYSPPKSNEELSAARFGWLRRQDRISPLMRYARLALFADPPQADRQLLDALTWAAKRHSQLPELFYLLGKAQELNEVSPVESYEMAVKLYPDFALAWRELARLRTDQGAIEALEQIVRLLPDDISAWDRLGDWHLSHGDVEAANQCWDRSYRLVNGE